MRIRPGCLAAACLVVFLAAAGASPVGARQLAGNDVHVTVRLVAAPPATDRPASAWLGLSFHMTDGWHIYWRNPGDAGGPPEVRWTLPPGLSAGPLRWPVPERVGVDGIVSYGYHGSVVLPVALQTAAAWPTAPFTVKAQVKWLACKDICVPGRAEVSLDLPERMAVAQAAGAATLRAAIERVPKPSPRGWRVSGAAGQDAFTLHLDTGRREAAADFFPSEPGQVAAGAPVKAAPREGGITLTVRKSEFLSQPVRTLKGVIVLPGGRAYDVEVPINDTP